MSSFLEEDAPALLGVDKHEALAGFCQVVPVSFHLEGLGAHEAVPARQVARCDVLDPEGDHLAAVEGHDPVDGPCEADLEIHPPHGLLEGDREDELGQDRGQKLDRVLALELLAGADVLALVRRDDLHLGDVDALPPGKTEGGLRGVALFVIGNLLCGPELLDDLVLLPFGYPGDTEREPPRGGHGLHRAVLDAAGGKLLPDHLLHVRDRLRQEGRGDLLRPDFEKQLFSHLKLQ
jgi:hypothetical protein